MDDIFADIKDKYFIHHEVYEQLGTCSKLPLKQSIASTDDMRFNYDTIHGTNDNGSFEGSIKELTVPSETDKDGIPVTVYIPSSATLTMIPTIMLFIHGGGLVMGTRKAIDLVMKKVSERSGVIIVSPEYRLLPCEEDPLAPFNDCVCVAEWLMQNKQVVGGADDSSVGIGGESAGGQIASCVLNDVDGLEFSVLVYPVTDLDFNKPTSCQEFKSAPAILTSDLLQQMYGLCIPAVPDAETNPRFNPSARDNLSSSPPTLIILAQLDPLRDIGSDFADKLKSLGVHVQVKLIEGVPHGFFTLPSIYKTASEQAIDTVVEFIKFEVKKLEKPKPSVSKGKKELKSMYEKDGEERSGGDNSKADKEPETKDSSCVCSIL